MALAADGTIFDGVAKHVKVNDLDEPHSSKRYHLGTRHFKNGNEYVYVYNGGGSDVTTGQYCVLQGVSSSFTSGYTVTVTNASLTGWLAGVFQTTCSAGNYGFVMVKGVSLVAVDSDAISAPVDANRVLGTDGVFRPAVTSMSVGTVHGYTLNTFITTVGTSKARIFGSIL